MSENNDKPSTWLVVEDEGGGGVGDFGMTLRDWFAGQALAGMGTWSPHDPENRPMTERRALLAYTQADAMLQARKS